MKVIVAGSRHIDDYDLVKSLLDPYEGIIEEVVHGDARGVDRLAGSWAHNQDIPTATFPADWEHLGRSAGIIRNIEMARYADMLIAIWDGASRGTDHMIRMMRKFDKPVNVIIVHLDDEQEII